MAARNVCRSRYGGAQASSAAASSRRATARRAGSHGTARAARAAAGPRASRHRRDPAASSRRRVVDQQLDRRRPERLGRAPAPRGPRVAARGSSGRGRLGSRRRPAMTRNSRAVRSGSSAGSGARTTDPGASARGRMTFSNRSWLCPIEPDSPLDDRRRAAVVDLEIDAPEARQRLPRSPARDGHRRVASRRSTGRRRRRGRSGSPARRAAAPSRSCDRSTSWTSSTSRWLHRRRHRSEVGRVLLEDRRERAGRGRRNRGHHARRAPARRRRRLARPARRRGRRRPRRRQRPRSSFSRENAVSRRPRSAGDVRGHSSAIELGAVDQRLDRTGRHRGGSRGRGHGTSGRGPSPAPTPSGASAASARSASSSAARLLKVIAAIVVGVERRRRRARRSGRPGSWSCRCPPARRTGPGPGGAVAAARWSGVSRARRSRTAGWPMRRTIAPGRLNRRLTAVQRPHGARNGDACQRTGTEGGRDGAPNRPIGPWRAASAAGTISLRQARRRVVRAGGFEDSSRCCVDPSAGRPCCPSACSSRSPARRRRIRSLRTMPTWHADHRREQAPRRRRPGATVAADVRFLLVCAGIQHVDAEPVGRAERGRGAQHHWTGRS